MKINIIKVGNSKGIILNKTILEKYNIGSEVNIRMEEERLIIEPIKNPRANWDEAFAKMNQLNDDKILIPDVFDDEQLPKWD